MTRKIEHEPAWLKTDTSGALVGVDRAQKAILGYVVAQEGDFKSEGRGAFDEKSLKNIVRLMSAQPHGVKSRFQHPDMSNDGLGKFLGRAKDARMDSVTLGRGKDRRVIQAVRADLYLSDTAFNTPAGDLGSYVLDLAESDPDALSSSLVLHADLEYRVDAKGRREVNEETGAELPPIWRPTMIHASDIVDTGDAVDGLLSVDSLPLAELWQGGKLLDQVFAGQSRETVEARCMEYLRRYLDRRYGAQETFQVENLRRRLATRLDRDLRKT